MVVSLYICEIPKNTIRKDIEDLFSVMEGYIETRMKNTNDKRKIAFVDFHAEPDAKLAMSTYQGFKFNSDDKGLIIKFSDNTKSGQTQPNKKESNRDDFINRKRKYSGDRHQSRSKYRNYSDDDYSVERSEDDQNIIGNHNMHGNLNSTSSNIANYGIPNNSSNAVNLQNPNNLTDLINLLNNTANNNTNITNQSNASAQFIKNPLNIPLSNTSLLLSNQDNSGIAGLNSNLNNTSLANSQNPDQSNNNNLNNLNNMNNLLEILHNIQTAQLLNSLGGGAPPQNFSNNPSSNPDSKNLQLLLNHLISQPTNNNIITTNHKNLNNNKNPHSNVNTSTTSNSKSTSFLNSVNKYDDKFKHFLDFKKNATNIVYVEGLPLNSTEREVAHIFRPFPGFKSVRLITRDKSGEKSVICFADFDDILQSTICINTLQGYRFDKNDLVGLHFSYGVSKQKK